MAARSESARRQQLHVVPIDDREGEPSRHLRSVDSQRDTGADIISIDSARRATRQHSYDRQAREPAMLAKWAVGLTFVMFLAALTSGQA